MTENRHKLLVTIASMTCVVHCLLSPVVVMGLPFLGSFFHHIFFEIFLFVFSFFCGFYIIYQGICRHKKQHAGILFFIGILFWLSHFFSEYIYFLDSYYFLFLALFFILLSYILNHYYLKCCSGNIE